MPLFGGSDRFHVATRIDAPTPEVFDLSLDIGGRTGIDERVVRGPTSGLLDVGTDIVWASRRLDIPLARRVRITELDRPFRYVEEVVDPLGSYRIEHFFVALDAAELTDIVEVHAPYGSLGALLLTPARTTRLRKLLERRNAGLKRAAESGTGFIRVEDEPRSGPDDIEVEHAEPPIMR